MKKQKVMSHMKGQNKTTERQLNEVEIGNLPEKGFRIMIVKSRIPEREWRRCKKCLPRRTKEQTNTEEQYTRRDQ